MEVISIHAPKTAMFFLIAVTSGVVYRKLLFTTLSKLSNGSIKPK